MHQNNQAQRILILISLKLSTHVQKFHSFLCCLAGLVLLVANIPYAHSQTTYDQAVNDIAHEIRENSKHLLYESRNSRLQHHGEIKKCSVLNLHGLYQSPKDQTTISDFLFKSGCNVYSPLLKAHWDKDTSAFRKITDDDWVQQIFEAYKRASSLGEKVTIIGHSTGGLLAFNLVYNDQFMLENKDQIKAIILLAPALELNARTQWLSQIGNLFNINRLNPSGFDPEYDTYPKPAHAGVIVNKLSKKWQQKAIALTIPKTLIYTTDLDDTVNNSIIYKLKETYPNEINWIHYTKDQKIFHDNIQRGPLDIPANAPSFWANPFMSTVLNQIHQIIFDPAN